MEYKYNRLGENTEIKDQRGVIRVLNYDKLGRQIHDRATTVPTGVGSSVQRILTNYDVRGLVAKQTSLSSATVSSGTVVNEVKYDYNSFDQLFQEHQSRRTAITYPDGSVGI